MTQNPKNEQCAGIWHSKAKVRILTQDHRDNQCHFNSDQPVKVWARLPLYTELKSQLLYFSESILYSRALCYKIHLRVIWRVWPVHKGAQTKLNAIGMQTLFSWFESFQGYCWKNKPTSYSSSSAIKQCFPERKVSHCLDHRKCHNSLLNLTIHNFWLS